MDAARASRSCWDTFVQHSPPEERSRRGVCTVAQEAVSCSRPLGDSNPAGSILVERCYHAFRGLESSETLTRVPKCTADFLVGPSTISRPFSSLMRSSWSTCGRTVIVLLEGPETLIDGPVFGPHPLYSRSRILVRAKVCWSEVGVSQSLNSPLSAGQLRLLESLPSQVSVEVAQSLVYRLCSPFWISRSSSSAAHPKVHCPARP